MRIPRSYVAMTAVTGLVTVVVAAQGPSADAHRSRTEATLRLADGTRVGTVDFDHRRSLTNVSVTLRLPAGVTTLDDFHGFHIHANNDPANGSGCVADPTKEPSTWFVSADGHYSEPGKTHGAHNGDLSSILVAANGRAYMAVTTGRVRPSELIGKAVILHAGRDNFGNIPLGTGPEQYTANTPAAVARTAATGNAGDRIACGVIRRG